MEYTNYEPKQPPKQYPDIFNRTCYHGQWCFEWEATVANKVKRFGYEDLGKQAISEGWWGYVHDNGVIPERGLANYIAEIYSQMIYNGYTDLLPRGLRHIPELGNDEMVSFKNFIASEEFKSMNLDRILETRVADIKAIKSEELRKRARDSAIVVELVVSMKEKKEW